MSVLHDYLVALAAERFHGDLDAALRAINDHMGTTAGDLLDLTEAEAESAVHALLDDAVCLDAIAIMDRCPL